MPELEQAHGLAENWSDDLCEQILFHKGIICSEIRGKTKRKQTLPLKSRIHTNALIRLVVCSAGSFSAMINKEKNRHFMMLMNTQRRSYA